MARTGRPKGSVTTKVPKRFSLAPLSKDSQIGSQVVRLSLKEGKSTKETLTSMASYFQIRDVDPIYLDANLYTIHTDHSEQVIWARINDEESVVKKVRNQASRLGLHFECVGRGAEIPTQKTRERGAQQKIA